MHALSKFHCICLLLGLSVIVGLCAAIAVAENDGTTRGNRATLRGPADVGLQSTVDWTALFLAEFAAGGAIENRYLPCDCDRVCSGDATECPLHDQALLADDEATAGDEQTDATAELTIESLWDQARLFAEGDNTQATDSGRSSVDDAEPRTNTPVVRRAPESSSEATRKAWRGSSQQFRQQPTPVRPGEAAAEILKLRRTIGVNPIAGTIFDQPAAESGSWTGQAPQICSGTDIAGEQTMAEAIRRLEVEQQAVGHAPAEFHDWPNSVAPSVWQAQLLRPAERKLEEAAELLEQLGQYDRADAAREMAAEIREDARQREKQAQRQQYGPVTIQR